MRPRLSRTFSPRTFSAFVFAALLAAVPLAAQAQPSITVFAAASMTTAIDDVNAAFTKETGIKATSSYAASSTLARQIEKGAPADIFISANVEWMDHVEKAGQVKPGSRFDLVGNRLVLIAPKDSKVSDVKIGKGFDLAGLVGNGRIATGEVTSVPVGRYAKQALERLGAWKAAEKKFAMADNVRAALVLVARGEARFGIVYETDAKVEPGVKVVGVFPDGSHPKIVYPVAATRRAGPAADKYLAFLRTPAMAKLFQSHGFTVLAK